MLHFSTPVPYITISGVPVRQVFRARVEPFFIFLEVLWKCTERFENGHRPGIHTGSVLVEKGKHEIKIYSPICHSKPLVFLLLWNTNGDVRENNHLSFTYSENQLRQMTKNYNKSSSYTCAVFQIFYRHTINIYLKSYFLKNFPSSAVCKSHLHMLVFNLGICQLGHINTDFLIWV